MAPLRAQGFCAMLIEAGVVTEERLNRTERLVIDVRSGDAVKVYTQEFGDHEALARLAPMLTGLFDEEGNSDDR